MSLKELLEVPPGVRAAADALAGLDPCFLVGFGRLGPEQVQALQAIGRVCAGTPLDGPVKAALDALERNEFVDRHFAAFAAARAALQGAQYDALRTQATTALGRAAADEPPTAEADGKDVPGPVAVWQESTRNWLMELALAGFKQLEYQTLAPFAATLEQLQGEPATTRLAALLTGFLHELLEAMPVAALPSVPLYRWVDLWTRAMIGSLRPPPALTGDKVSGTLSVLGVDLHHHSYFVSLDVYALLEQAGQTRVVRTTVSSYKVDVVHGPEMWQCFDRELSPLLRAVSQHLILKVRDMTLLPTGDLLWDGDATPGKPYPFMEVAARRLAPGAAQAPPLPAVAAADRHPVQIAELVYLDKFQVKNGHTVRLELGDGALLDVAADRISAASELQPEHVANATALLGLLRFDGGRWSVQPLAVTTGGKKPVEVFTGSGADAFVNRKKNDTLAVLQERASRLLRKKS